MPTLLSTRERAHLCWTVRKAAMRDIRPILELINGYAAKGTIALAHRIRAFRGHSRFHRGYGRQGTAGLRRAALLQPTVAEIRSLAVDERAKTQGVGRKLVEALAAEADQYELDAVFAFTYVPEFFKKVGFDQVERGRAAAESLEGLRPLSQISGLRRNRGPARSAPRPLDRVAGLGPAMMERRPVDPDPDPHVASILRARFF